MYNQTILKISNKYINQDKDVYGNKIKKPVINI